MRSPGQELQQTQHRTPEPELTQQNMPENMLNQTPQNTPQQTPEQNTPDESSLVSSNDVWKVGTMHTDGRLRVEVIEKLLEPSCKCSHKIIIIMYERLEPTGFTWKEVSKDTKQFYYEEFKKWFVRRQPDNIIYEGWSKNAAIRYKDLRGSASSRTHSSRLAEEWDRDPNSAEIFEYMHTKMHDKKTFINKKSAEISEKLNALRAERCQPTDGSSVPQLVDENRFEETGE
ncbi:hypothetical protein POM88_024377 [Heracleum sosnowskyi]|uniref:Transposase n=1 Tax=Heracleum sosnowskyi TaxID=360622 RepID=A0AAD8I2R3_9APIA|nr:hypothetical protein POM88_024377 [Heracleum sosnowskyi]